MHFLLADENFSLAISSGLRKYGHDVVSLQDLGLAGIKFPDEEVLKKAVELERCVLTFNKKDFIQLHKKNPNHKGIVVCTFIRDANLLMDKIHSAIENESDLANRLIRIYND
jgi:predicted nuclease of predicted toxin-antitoxin system